MNDRYAGIEGQDREIEDEVRDLRYYGWDPLYHKRIFTSYQELVNAINNENGRLEFFSGLPTPRNRHLTNLKQDQQFPYSCNIDGTGVHVFGEVVADLANGAVDIRRAIIENTRWNYIVQDNRPLCDHPTLYMSPGAQVAGQRSSTQTLVDRVESVHGFNHPLVYYRFGGLDRTQIVQMERHDNHIGYLWFNAELITFLTALADQEVAINDMGILAIMATIYPWDYQPVS